MPNCQEDEEAARQRKTQYRAMGKQLNELIASDFDYKLLLSTLCVEQSLKQCKRPVVASSFGKDSMAMLHLVHSVDNSVPVVFTNTGVNFRETITYMREMEKLWGLEIHELKPETTFWKIVEEHGFPKEARNSKLGDKREPKCCKLLKHEPMKKFAKENKLDMVFVGLLGDEGRQRRWVYIYKGGPIYDAISDGYSKCIPLIWWTEEDVWHYHDINGIPRNPVYAKYDIRRTGCVPCTGHKHWESQLARTHPKMYKLIQHKLG